MHTHYLPLTYYEQLNIKAELIIVEVSALITFHNLRGPLHLRGVHVGVELQVCARVFN